LLLSLIDATLVLKVICWINIFLLQFFVACYGQVWVKFLSIVLVILVQIEIGVQFILKLIHHKLIIKIVLIRYLFIYILKLGLICSLCETHLLFILDVLVLIFIISLRLLHIITLWSHAHRIFIVLALEHNCYLIRIFTWLSFFF
jgi:hypothetical protein